jgi:hypothetical protein
MEINLTSVGPSPANGCYSHNFRRLGKPTEFRSLNIITRARPYPTSMPTLRSITAAAPSSNPYSPPIGSSTPPPPLQLAPPQALPCLSHPITLACCYPCLSLSLSLKQGPHTHAIVAWSAPSTSPPSPTPGLPSYPPHYFPSRQPRHRRPRPPAPTSSTAARPSSASPGPCRPALDAATHLPWPLLHPTLSTSRPPTPPASLSHCPAHRPPNSGQRLWTSLARLPPLDATSRLGLPPLDAIGQLARALVRYSSPTAANECPSKV